MNRIIPVALCLGGLLAACSGESKPPPTVAIADAWCRAAPEGAPAGGCYLTLTSTQDDRLVAVETTAADHGEIHTMDMAGGVMRMRVLPEGIALPAGEPVRLMPGARHLMVIGPKATLDAGGEIPLTLRFEKAAAVSVAAPIREAGAMQGHH